MSEISFKVSKEEHTTIVKIVERAVKTATDAGYMADRQTTEMDLVACHANDIPLDLDGLLVANDFDFAHDIFGIQTHIDRETGKLGHCFLPRYSRSRRGR